MSMKLITHWRYVLLPFVLATRARAVRLGLGEVPDAALRLGRAHERARAAHSKVLARADVVRVRVRADRLDRRVPER